MTTTNPLLSSHKASDSGLQVLLHPMVLLTISDYITRHTLRQLEGPVVGALLGQQHGRDISLEHAFECKLVKDEGDSIVLHQSWFEERLQQFKDVHKAPALDLVGWFSLAPTSGPQSHHLPIHRQILHTYNESAILLTFHPTTIVDRSGTGGELPLTIYESNYEGESSGDGDKTMQVEGEESSLQLKFRELPYTVETGEAEMISVDFVARGGGNATAMDVTPKKPQASAKPVLSDGGRVAGTDEGTAKTNGTDETTLLSPEDEELIASLTARANAIKMLHSRIQLLRSYLANLPQSYLTTSEPPDPSSETTASSQHTEINYPILRSIQALISRLPLLIPANRGAFRHEVLAEKNDVSLVAMLGTLSKSVKDVSEMGRKFGIMDNARQSSRKDNRMIGEDFLGGFGGNGVGRYPMVD
ncbi:MAG: hypothetical protein M1836_006445 [Candelina mexicana]|nr:MAG: hypothetical protein M1836_006445 [Candelina mexicana]